MIIPIRSGEWSQWAGGRDEEYFARLLNGYGWRIAVRNQDFRRLVEDADETDLFQDEPDTMSIDAVATFWDPCRQRYEAVFIEAKRRTNKPSPEDITAWIEKCRSAQQYVEASDDIQRMLCAGIPQIESVQCSKSILFIDCDAWKNTWSDRLVDLLPIQKRTSGSPRRVQIIDHTRAIWMQNALDILGLLRGPGNLNVQEYKVYYWKRGFNSNVSFDHLSSEIILFEVSYSPDEKRDLIMVSYEQIGTEVATYYGEQLLELLDIGAHGYNRLIIYTSFELDQLAIQSAEGILKDIINPIAPNVRIEVQVRTLPTGLNR